ncbi:MAG: ABC transporter substrate-binding protein [Hyphomonadaceae bacterium]|nr:ABC transporter substrate-binding protein [Hyphomonadaceae bacterium]
MSKSCVVGFLADLRSGDRMKQYEQIAQMAFDECRRSGAFNLDVDLRMKEVEGLPRGSGDDVVAAYEELAAEGAVAIIGPFVTDNCTYLKPTVERIGVPAIAWCGASSWLGRWTFSLPNGSLLDEGPYLAAYARRKGYRHVAVLRDASEIGDTYWRFFERAARRYGLSISSNQAIEPLATDLSAEIRLARETGADALVYLGYGMSLLGVNAALDGWDVPRLATTAFVFCYRPQYLPAFEGWSGLDQLDPANPERIGFLERCQKRFGWTPQFMSATLMYDSARVVAEALGMTEALTPEGVREGLEGVRLLPAASGGAGTMISFGPYSHKGWEGARYLVMGKVRDGKPSFEAYVDP